MNKIIKGVSIAAVFLLFVAPILSYYYLNSGINYRKEKLAELEVKATLPAFQIQQDSAFSFNNEELKGKVTLMGFLDRLEDEGIYKKLINNFDDRNEFQLVTFVDAKDGEMRLENRPNWKIMYGDVDLFDNFRKEYLIGLDGYADGDIHVLLDTSLQIRRIYSIDEQFEMKQVVEHIPVVLPRTEDSDIQLKRD